MDIFPGSSLLWYFRLFYKASLEAYPLPTNKTTFPLHLSISLGSSTMPPHPCWQQPFPLLWNDKGLDSKAAGAEWGGFHHSRATPACFAIVTLAFCVWRPESCLGSEWASCTDKVHRLPLTLQDRGCCFSWVFFWTTLGGLHWSMETSTSKLHLGFQGQAIFWWLILTTAVGRTG